MKIKHLLIIAGLAVIMNFVGCKRNRVNDPTFILPQPFVVQSPRLTNGKVILPLGVESEITLKIINDSGGTIKVSKLSPAAISTSLKVSSFEKTGDLLRVRLIPLTYLENLIEIGNSNGRIRLRIGVKPND